VTALPRFEQTRLADEHAAAVTEGELTLQQCQNCSAVQYPYRELCGDCLADALQWKIVDGSGTVTAAVRIHSSMHTFFRDSAPWRICSVTLDVGPRVIAHAKDGEVASGSRVAVVDERISPSHSVLVAQQKAQSGKPAKHLA
jgi:uncharacterized OB-fold protein